MFLDVLDLIFDNFSGVISALNVDLFKLGSVGVSFWELILGILTVSILFGFFLAPRPGSVLGGISNINSKHNAEARRAESDARRAESDARRAHSQSYDAYKERRVRNSLYKQRFREEGKVNK